MVRDEPAEADREQLVETSINYVKGYELHPHRSV